MHCFFFLLWAHPTKKISTSLVLNSGILCFIFNNSLFNTTTRAFTYYAHLRSIETTEYSDTRNNNKCVPRVEEQRVCF